MHNSKHSLIGAVPGLVGQILQSSLQSLSPEAGYLINQVNTIMTNLNTMLICNLFDEVHALTGPYSGVPSGK